MRFFNLEALTVTHNFCSRLVTFKVSSWAGNAHIKICKIFFSEKLSITISVLHWPLNPEEKAVFHSINLCQFFSVFHSRLFYFSTFLFTQMSSQQKDDKAGSEPNCSPPPWLWNLSLWRLFRSLLSEKLRVKLKEGYVKMILTHVKSFQKKQMLIAKSLGGSFWSLQTNFVQLLKCYPKI